MSESFPILSLLTFAPLLGAALLYLIPAFKISADPNGSKAQSFSFLVSILIFLAACYMLIAFDGTSAEMQFQEQIPWIPAYGISYHLGVDGISVFLIMLSTFLMPLIFLSSGAVKNQRRGYLANMLILESAMIGTLLSLDVFLFYVFWELMLTPMYFIIGIWGGRRKIYATLKFVLYTVFGSLLMLLAIFYVVWQYWQQTGDVTFALSTLVNGTMLSLKEEILLFAAFALAFGIKVPIFPFHTWLPDAHVEAPTGGSVVLAGVLLKMGIYGFIRFAYPLLPRGAEAFAPYLAGLAVIGIIYGALVAWAQSDIKKLVAYSSVSHLGYCVLGLVALNTISVSGSIYQMLNHGISTGALFLLVGVLYDRKHTREIADYQGLASKIPVFAFLFLVFTLSSIGLPLTNGFIGEFLILTGSFKSFPIMTMFAVLGVILGAVYMLSLYMKTMYGELNTDKNSDLTDVNRIELATFIPLFILVFYMGIFPQAFLSTIEPSVNHFIEQVEQRSQQLEIRESVQVSRVTIKNQEEGVSYGA
ncbi:MAG: NADH-quinone oxidoreductase subunit M [Bdellovibrionota bacterium]